jgi:hypothetical protein
MEMTIEQKRALAMAQARARAAAAESQGPDMAARAAASGASMRNGQINYGVELEKQAIDEMSGPERAFRSLGAGFADIPLAFKQIFNRDPDKAKQLNRESADKREVDKYLSKKTDMGVLPDQVLGIDTPTVGSTAQFYGKTAPTMLLPAARLAGLKGFFSNVGVGAGLSALDPTVEGESRGMNMAIGGASSGVLPMATSAVKSVYNSVTRGGGQNRAGDELAKVLTEGGANEAAVLRQTIDRLKQAQQGNIPLSTAAQLRDPSIARLEQGSRARNGANWYDFDQNQARAVSGEFDMATREAAELAARRGTRKSNWDTNWASAQTSADVAKFAQDLPKFRSNLDVAMMSPEASNPATRAMLQAIAADIDRVTSAGMAYTPAHLQQIRANLSAKWHPMNSNAFTQADRSSPARLSVMQEVDNILNATTGGKWQGVVDNYAADSRVVDAAKAAGRAREPFYDEKGRVRKVAADTAGDVPKITESSLGVAMDRGKGQFSTDAETRLNAILEALRAQNIVQGVKRSATAGGGSDTASNMYAAKTAGKVADALGASGSMTAAATSTVLDKLGQMATATKDRALAEALQNPQQMVQVLERKLKAGAPLSTQEQYLLSLLRGAPAAATSN